MEPAGVTNIVPIAEPRDFADRAWVVPALEQRMGAAAARQRIAMEAREEIRIFGHGLNFFHPENWHGAQSLITAALKAGWLYRRGERNAENVQLRRNPIASAKLPASFAGFRILHLSDLHADKNPKAMARIFALVKDLDYDLCVLTGDYRGGTSGPYRECLRGMESLRAHIRGEIWGVLGNHDTIMMVPGLEQCGIKILLNESLPIVRGDQRIYLAGVDDAHYFKADRLDEARAAIPAEAFSLLLSHTPEIYRQSAAAGFDVMLSGHTHGGQICLPGGFPITLDSVLPRAFGAGAWRYQGMCGYTSVGAGTSIVPVRLNCLPEITLHELCCA